MDSKELNRIYGERLCLARKMRGLSMDELVAKMGDKAVTKQAISKYEQGKMMPVPEVRKALAKILGLTEGWFYGKMPDFETGSEWHCYTVQDAKTWRY